MDLLYILNSLSQQKSQHAPEQLRNRSNRILVMKNATGLFPFTNAEHISLTNASTDSEGPLPHCQSIPSITGRGPSRPNSLPNRSTPFKKLSDFPKSLIKGWKSFHLKHTETKSNDLFTSQGSKKLLRSSTANKSMYIHCNDRNRTSGTKAKAVKDAEPPATGVSSQFSEDICG